MNRLLVIFVGTILLCFSVACNLLRPNFKSEDPFYQDLGEIDAIYLPLLAPYKAIKINKDLGWTMDLEGSPSKDATIYISIKDIKAVAVEEGWIFVYTEYIEESVLQVGGKVFHWFVIYPEQNLEQGFESERDFHQYLQEKNLNEPTWVNPDQAFGEFEKTGCLAWIPECKEGN